MNDVEEVNEFAVYEITFGMKKLRIFVKIEWLDIRIFLLGETN